jgi:hypothetical protein
MTERAYRLAAGSGGWELASWYLMRLSGILLFGLALGHLFIMHVLHGVEAIDSSFVLNRLVSPIWQVYDWLLLTLALLHGWNGLRNHHRRLCSRPGLADDAPVRRFHRRLSGLRRRICRHLGGLTEGHPWSPRTPMPEGSLRCKIIWRVLSEGMPWSDIIGMMP